MTDKTQHVQIYCRVYSFIIFLVLTLNLEIYTWLIIWEDFIFRPVNTHFLSQVSGQN